MRARLACAARLVGARTSLHWAIRAPQHELSGSPGKSGTFVERVPETTLPSLGLARSAAMRPIGAGWGRPHQGP